MEAISVREIPAESARSLFPVIDEMKDAVGQQAAPGRGVAMHVPRGQLHAQARDADVDTDVLLFLLPDRMLGELDAWANCEFDVVNEDSADLRTRRSLLTLDAGDASVRIDLWALQGFSEDQQYGEAFHVGLLCGQRFLLCRHQLGFDGMQSLVAGMQGCCMASGVNYNPRMIWSEAEMCDVEGAPEAEQSSLELGVMEFL